MFFLILIGVTACGAEPQIPATLTASTVQQRDELVKRVGDLGYTEVKYVGDAQIVYSKGALQVAHVQAKLGRCERHFLLDGYGGVKVIRTTEGVDAAVASGRVSLTLLAGAQPASGAPARSMDANC